MATNKVKKKAKSAGTKHTVDSITKTVREISTMRKIELADDPDVSKAICDLADYAGELFYKLLDEAIQNESDVDKKKNMLLVLQLTYLKMSSQLLGNAGKIDLASEIPTSGFMGCKPIDMKEEMPMYY
jgi:hypothetical protein